MRPGAPRPRSNRPRRGLARRAPRPWPPALRVGLVGGLALLLGCAGVPLYQRDRRIHTQRRLDHERFLRDYDQRQADHERHLRLGVFAR